MKISEIKDIKLRELARLRQSEQDYDKSAEAKLGLAFDWSRTVELADFWDKVNDGIFTDTSPITKTLCEEVKVNTSFKKDDIRPIPEIVEKTILEEAQDAVYGDRNDSYGTATENFTRTAKLWSPILGIEVTPEQVGLCMVQLKVARQVFKPKRDNLVDGAGYFATLEKLTKGE